MSHKINLPSETEDHTTLSQILHLNRCFFAYVETPYWQQLSKKEKAQMCMTMHNLNKHCPGAVDG